MSDAPSAIRALLCSGVRPLFPQTPLHDWRHVRLLECPNREHGVSPQPMVWSPAADFPPSFNCMSWSPPVSIECLFRCMVVRCAPRMVTAPPLASHTLTAYIVTHFYALLPKVMLNLYRLSRFLQNILSACMLRLRYKTNECIYIK